MFIREVALEFLIHGARKHGIISEEELDSVEYNPKRAYEIDAFVAWLAKLGIDRRLSSAKPISVFAGGFTRCPACGRTSCGSECRDLT